MKLGGSPPRTSKALVAFVLLMTAGIVASCVVAQGTAIVRVKAVGSLGQILQGAHVSITGAHVSITGAAADFSGETDSSGYISALVPFGTYDIVVTYQTAAAVTTISVIGDIEVTMRVGISIELFGNATSFGGLILWVVVVVALIMLGYFAIRLARAKTGLPSSPPAP